MSFNPRTREGCDIEELLILLQYLVSIHAPVKGATFTGFYIKLFASFNPRTREGCDTLFAEINFDISHVSIHAPVKGATVIPKVK